VYSVFILDIILVFLDEKSRIGWNTMGLGVRLANIEVGITFNSTLITIIFIIRQTQFLHLLFNELSVGSIGGEQLLMSSLLLYDSLGKHNDLVSINHS
jgi:hypothetical protein